MEQKNEGDGMTLLDGGSKENWAERVRAKNYPLVYVLIVFTVLLHIASGHPWRTSLILGIAMFALAIWQRPRSD